MARVQRERKQPTAGAAEAMGDTLELTYQQSERQHAALVELSGRALASVASEDRVFDLLLWYDPAHEKYVKLRDKAVAAIPAPKDSDESGLPEHVKEARVKAVQAILDTKHRMRRVPTRMVLTAADMPRRDIKGEVGMANKTGVSNIKWHLGSLFERAREQEPIEEDPHRDVGDDEER